MEERSPRNGYRGVGEGNGSGSDGTGTDRCVPCYSNGVVFRNFTSRA